MVRVKRKRTEDPTDALGQFRGIAVSFSSSLATMFLSLFHFFFFARLERTASSPEVVSHVLFIFMYPHYVWFSSSKVMPVKRMRTEEAVSADVAPETSEPTVLRRIATVSTRANIRARLFRETYLVPQALLACSFLNPLLFSSFFLFFSFFFLF